MESAADLLNEADGKIGDGDLGVTMVRGSRHLKEVLADLPDDVGMALMSCAQAFTKSSGSSFGTLLAPGLMSAATRCRGRNVADVDGDQMLTAATAAVDETLVRFRDQPRKVGRARIFGEKTIGLDDPGMLALREMITGLRSA